MPQLLNSNDELSLRHLPDVSDTSFSFQIPGAIRGDDNNLLVDDDLDLDFFKGAAADVSTIVAPLGTPTTATPKPEKPQQVLPSTNRVDSFPSLSYAHLKRQEANPPSKVSTTDSFNVLSGRATSDDVLRSPAVADLRVELNDKLVAGPGVDHPADIRILRKPHERKLPRNNQKVMEGGISKTRYAPKVSPITCSLSMQQTMVSDTEQVNKDYSFADSSMSSATGAAGRLVMYSQKLVNPFGVLGSDKSLEASSSQDPRASSDDQNADIALTLSPQRAAAPSRYPIPTPHDDVPSLKRPISVLFEKRKKSKTEATSADVSVVKPGGVFVKSRLPVTRRHPKGISTHSSSLHRRKSTSTRVCGPEIKRRPVFKAEGRGLEDNGKETSASSSSCAEPVNSITKDKRTVSGSSRVVSCDVRQPAVSQMNRKGLDSEVEPSEKRYHIPDFKSMHAAQDADIVQRKENIKPVVPLPIRFETEYRVKERQKYDERMREKEREEERAEEKRRREREEREEREVRELRKRAVPKAHEVPEWYKEAPKRTKG